MIRPDNRQPEAGVVLVNVLVVIALAAGIVMLMLTAQEAAVERARLSASRAQAEALAMGAEASVLVALRRDMTEAPGSDHLNEDWAAVVQEAVELETGRFSVKVEDLRGRYDLNRLAERRVADIQQFIRLVEVLGLPRDVGPRIAAALAQEGRIADLERLDRVGVTRDQRAVLAPHVVAAPVPGPINLNTVGEAVLSAVMGNPRAVVLLLRQRARTGVLRPLDLTDLGLIQPPGTGFTSDLYESTVRAEVDGVEVVLTSTILRKRDIAAQEVVVIQRSFGVPEPVSEIPPEDF